MRFALGFALSILTVSNAFGGVVIDYIGIQAGIFDNDRGAWIGGAYRAAGADLGTQATSDSSAIDYPFYDNKSIVSYDVQQSARTTTIEFTWDHRIVGLTDDEAYGFGFVDFTPDVDLRYEITGRYSVLGDSSPYQLVQAGSYVSPFYIASFKESRSTPNETLILGDPVGGDYENYVEGSFTGILHAGERYGLSSLYYLHAYQDGSESVAVGNVRISLSALDASPVPEPSSLVLFGITAVGLCASRLRNKFTARGYTKNFLTVDQPAR